MAQPDPIDGLKYAWAHALHIQDGGAATIEDHVHLLEVLLSRFLPPDMVLGDLRYSDGRAVLSFTEVGPGETMRSHFPPPGYDSHLPPTANR